MHIKALNAWQLRIDSLSLEIWKALAEEGDSQAKNSKAWCMAWCFCLCADFTLMSFFGTARLLAVCTESGLLIGVDWRRLCLPCCILASYLSLLLVCLSHWLEWVLLCLVLTSSNLGNLLCLSSMVCPPDIQDWLTVGSFRWFPLLTAALVKVRRRITRNRWRQESRRLSLRKKPECKVLCD